MPGGALEMRREVSGAKAGGISRVVIDQNDINTDEVEK